MSYSANQIVQDILSHISNCSGRYYSDFYVGITNDIDKRLFSEHKVDKQSGCWVYRQATSSEVARQAEAQLIAKGMKGGGGGGDYTSVYVYCYQITGQTTE
jgi:hypothetical protein